jgi:tetratricopeptide (TPR) repeat protein
MKTLNIATIHLNTGKMYYYNEDYKNGIACFNNALEIFKKNNSLPEIAECLTFLADSFYFLEEFDKAISYRLQVVSIHENASMKMKKS